MPDLSLKTAHKYWFEYRDSMIYKVLAFMEGVEDWALDSNAELEDAIQQFGKILDEIGNVNLEKESEIIQLALYIRASRMLLLLQYLDTASPGSASKILMHAENTSTSVEDIPGVFLRRNIVFERLRLLGRVFSAERLELITKALESDIHA